MLSLILPLLLLFSVLAHAQNEEPKESPPVEEFPVVVDIPADELARMTPFVKAAVGQLTFTIMQEVKVVKNFRIDPPESLFKPGAVIVHFNDLFRSPNEAEVAALGRVPLDESQKEQLKSEGMIVVPSQEFPGQNHVWKVSWLVQAGSKNISISLKDKLGQAARHLVVKVPARIFGQAPLSFRNGFHHLGHALRDSLATLVGFVEKRPLYSDTQVDEMVQTAAREATFKAFEEQWPKSEVQFDLSLYNPRILEKITPIVEEIANELQTEWVNEIEARLEAEWRQELTVGGFDEAKIPKIIAERLEAARLDLFYKRLRESRDLTQFGSQIPELLINRNRAQRIVQAYEQMFSVKVAHNARVLEAEIKKDHPIRSLSAKWLQSEVEAQNKAYYQSRRAQWYEEIVVSLRSQGLPQESAILARHLDFLFANEARMREELSAQTRAARVFTEARDLWQSKNWTITKHEPENAEAYYTGQDQKGLSVTTNYPLWRLRLVGMRSYVYMMNGLHEVLVRNLWNGPVGIRSLVNLKGESTYLGQSTFFASKAVDSKTGEIIDDARSETNTLVSRWRNITQNLRTSLAEASQGEGEGILPPAFNRGLAKGFHYTINGIAYVVLGIGQPVVTACNVLLSGVVACTAPVWAPAAALAVGAFNMLVYDLDQPDQNKSLSPLLYNFFWRGLIAGAGQVTIGAPAAVMYHLGASGTIAASAVAKSAVLKTWDQVMRTALVDRDLLRIPGRNNWLARRISGPGLNQEYFYQIRPQLALVALQATLEGIEFATYYKRTTREINAPVERAKEVLNDLFGYFAAPQLSDSAVMKIVEESVKEPLKALETARDERARATPDITESSVERARIRLAKQDLIEALDLGSALVEEFYKAKIWPQLDERSRLAFWNRMEVMEGDYLALTRKLFANTFGEGILTTLEEIDPSFLLQVREDSFTENFERIVEGLPTGLRSDEERATWIENSLRPAARYRPVLASAAPLVSQTLEPCESNLIKR